MSDVAAMEGEILRVLRAPERLEYPIEGSATTEEIYRQSLIDTYFAARQAWVLAGPMAVSYRNCIVVAASNLILPGDTQKIHRVFGYNFKPAPGDTPNIHSEEMILHQANVLGGTCLGITVVGEPQVDNSISGNDLVLAPCDYRCTPKIIADSSVGSFTMTTCVNPLTGATQFIPHNRLVSRDWLDDIPCIEVDSLNDHNEWLDKALPIIDLLIQNTDLDELEAFIERKKALFMSRLVQLMMDYLPNSDGGFHFFASPSSSVATNHDVTDANEIFGPKPAAQRLRIILGNILDPGDIEPITRF